MNGLIVFNSANDVVFQQLNSELQEKIREIAAAQGLIGGDDATTAQLDDNVLLQIFSPVISSQRIMHAQFDNTYASFQCENGLNFAFGDLLGFSFVKIGQRPVEQLKRHLGVGMALTRRLYGANLFAAAGVQEELLRDCLRCYEQHLWDEEQGMLLEALPRLLINAELRRAVRGTLDAALERLRDLGHQRAHVLIFVAHKFVGVASTRQALAMGPSDLLFLALLNRSLQRGGKRYMQTSVAVFLQGVATDPQSGCVPCIAHLSQLNSAGVVLVQIIEYANLQVASSMYDTFFVLQKIVALQTQGEADALRPAYESLESFVRQTLDALKRAKLRGDELDASLKKFTAKWENLRKMYVDFLKQYERELLVRIESNIPAFNEDLKQLFALSCCDSSAVALDPLSSVAAVVEGRLLEFAEFLAVKAERNISIEMEDFPGLVHFIYVNRSSGLMIAPDLRANQLVPRQRLWAMVEFSRSYLKKGQSTVLWKDKTFNYSYFLWFEDQGSGAVKTVDLQQHFVANNNNAASANAFKPQYEPGLLASDYYQQLVEVCFPKAAAGKIKCYELFCIHLGLVTATCAAEHSRRLVATIADVVGEE